MKYKLLFILSFHIFYGSILFFSCKDKSSDEDLRKVKKSEAQQNTVKKPMALAMRGMLNQMEVLHKEIIGKPDNYNFSVKQISDFPFEKLEPTDSSVLNKDFYQKAVIYHSAFNTFSEDRTVANYNLLINQCVSCHNNYCPGPLKRITKLFLSH